MRSIREADVSGKTVIVRVDLDVPLENGHVTDKTRVEKGIETLRFLLDKNAKIFLISHLGRPQGKDPNFSLTKVQPIIEELLKQKIAFQPDLDTKVAGQVVLLENLRFWEGEEKNDLEFAKKIAGFGQVYVFECFSVAHRTHTSVARLPKLLPSYPGWEFSEEINELETVFKNPLRPLVAIIGGAKIETKLPTITNLAKSADKVLVGGRLMFEVDKSTLAENVIVASDHVDEKDIGPESLKIFQEEIAKARMIVWNGPMGVFEMPKFAEGTFAIARMLADSGATTVIGGGDSASAVKKAGVAKQVTHVSTGGGASLEFLEGKELPGVAALMDK